MVEFFRKERVSFKFNGGDLENFVHFSKLTYARNKIFKVGDNQKIIHMDDVLCAFEMYGANRYKSLCDLYLLSWKIKDFPTE